MEKMITVQEVAKRARLKQDNPHVIEFVRVVNAYRRMWPKLKHLGQVAPKSKEHLRYVRLESRLQQRHSYLGINVLKILSPNPDHKRSVKKGKKVKVGMYYEPRRV